MWLYIYTACLLPTALVWWSYFLYSRYKQRPGVYVEATIVATTIVGYTAVLIVLILGSPDIYNSLTSENGCRDNPTQERILGASFILYVFNVFWSLIATFVACSSYHC